MKILRRCRRITDLEIVLRTQLQVALEACARMLRSLSLVTMRQQHSEPRSLFPLVFGSGDVLIDDRLCTISEITKLRFPKHEGGFVDDCVAILKSEHALFRQRTIKHIKARFRIRLRTQLRQRRPCFAGLRVVKHSMTLTKRAAP